MSHHPALKTDDQERLHDDLVEENREIAIARRAEKLTQDAAQAETIIFDNLPQILPYLQSLARNYDGDPALYLHKELKAMFRDVAEYQVKPDFDITDDRDL